MRGEVVMVEVTGVMKQEADEDEYDEVNEGEEAGRQEMREKMREDESGLERK